ncbi:helix-turn-helix domain-containing protein [Paraburkholderia sp. ZP32-5]|uniref:helix-turn-helix domain-containing protein n=1 Tax=Paraburkholderia sp. ZP32-5 TaxID=2883245 RepID=UPI001F38DBBB|nr:helix-turn-helix transcriptional regulator [Paraburkholderia sp. ZP32-5]
MPKKAKITAPLSAVVGSNIKARRAELGLTQNALAQALGVEIETISRYERGAVAPSFPQLEKLCTALSVKAWQLFSDGSVVPNANGQTLDDLLADLSGRDREFVLDFVRGYVAHHGRSQ